MTSKDFWSQTDLNRNNFVFRNQREIPMDADKLEKLLHEYQADLNPEEKIAGRKEYFERRKDRVETIFKTAAKILTDIQYQIFTAYHVIGMSELEIADSFNVTQPYISIVLTACTKKIKKQLILIKKL